MFEARLSRLDYYSLLEVEPDATEADLRAAFRRFARRYHPDRFAGQSDEKIERATAIYRRGSEAFQVLLRPESRRAYDEAVAKGRLRLTADQCEAALRPRTVSAFPDVPTDLRFQSQVALAFYRKALSAIASEDWVTALSQLREATKHEPGNFIVEARLEQVESLLRKR